MMTKISYILFDFFVGVWSLAQGAGAANFEIRNQCAYTVWAAGLPGGGAELQSRQSWRVGVAPGTRGGRFWGRTGCNFDQSGRGSCQTGDCGGLLVCQNRFSGKPPTTLVEYTLTGDNNMDTYDISLVNGFNLRVSVHPSTSNGKCHDIACNSDITSKCPSVLKVEGGCNSACDAIMPHNDLYCCTNAYSVTCPPNDYSKFFKQQCPQAYSYAKDDPSSTFVCPVGTDYTIVFCP